MNFGLDDPSKVPVVCKKIKGESSGGASKQQAHVARV